ncbi:MAG: AAA family ATPase [Gammaproteobacteria bacterium]|nr:AAA family ATPase [Gammaproteobacteria bacterium]
MTPNFEQAQHHLNLLDWSADQFTFQTFDDNKKRKDRSLARVLNGTLEEHWSELCWYSERGAGVFITVNKTDLKGRTADNVIKARCMFQEDDGDGKPLPLEPNFVIETSPGKHHRYLLTSTDNFDEWSQVQQRLVNDYGSDPNAKDKSRVLRLAGFPHQKGDPHMVQIVYDDCDQPYSWDQIKEAIPPLLKSPQNTKGLTACYVNPQTVTELRSALNQLRADERKEWVDIGMALKSLGETGRGLWMDWSQSSGKYDMPDAAYTWDSLKPAKISYESVFHKAQEAGWVNPASNIAHTPAMTEPAKTAFAPEAVKASLLADVLHLPPRDWLAHNILLRGYITTLFSPGGVGKSIFQVALAICLAAGNDFMEIECQQSKVLLINNEDDTAELKRRIAAICQYWGVSPKDLEDRFYYCSGYGSPIMLAQQGKDGVVQHTLDFADIKQFIVDKGIDVVMVDPFISTHDIPENDNTSIDKVVTIYKRLAHEAGVSICLIHHTKKSGTDSEIHAGDAEAGRGASSLKDAARCVATLAKMNQKTGDRLNLDSKERAHYVRLDTGKLNFGLAVYAPRWFKLESVCLPNGDYVGVPAPADMEPLFEKAKTEDGHIKWTATVVAESIESIYPKKKDSEQWTNIREKFKSENEIGDTQANNKITLLSQDEKTPTRISVQGILIDYYITKKGPKSPWIIHRQEISC